MANTMKQRGLDPIWHGTTPPRTSFAATLVNGTYNYFINSAVYSGVSGLHTTGTTAGTLSCTGSVVMLYDASGAPAHNLNKASVTSCSAEYTSSPAQRYLITCESTGVDATPGDLGANLTAETSTVGTGFQLMTSTGIGDHFSKRQIENASVSTTRTSLTLWIVSASPQIFGNAAATALFECEVFINPAVFV